MHMYRNRESKFISTSDYTIRHFWFGGRRARTAPISCKAGRGQCVEDFPDRFQCTFFSFLPWVLPTIVYPFISTLSVRLWKWTHEDFHEDLVRRPSPLRPACITLDVNIIEMEKKRAFPSFLIFQRFFEVDSVPYSELEEYSTSCLCRSCSQGVFLSMLLCHNSAGRTRVGSLLFGRGLFCFLFKFGSESEFFFSLALCIFVGVQLLR